MYKGRLFVVSGPSGAGKGTICRKLKEETSIELSVSMTTRSPRPDEIEGENYYFTSQETFQQAIRSDGFLEYAKVYDHYYGTPKKTVLDMLEEGKDVLLEIDIQGALQIRDRYPEGVFIFVLPPSMMELRKRITGRGSESENAINLRLGEALKEVSYIDKYDYCIINGELSEAVSRAKAIITAEHSKVSKAVYELIEKYKEEM